MLVKENLMTRVSIHGSKKIKIIMDPSKYSETAPEVKERPSKNEKAIQAVTIPSEELVAKLNALAKAIRSRNLRKEKKDDPL